MAIERARLEPVQEARLRQLEIPEIPATRVYLLAKRIIDFVVACVALVVAAPIMLVTAIAIKLESAGPLFFSQIRLGKGGVPFVLYKFRSMCEEATTLRVALEGLNEVSGPVFKIREDPRITTVGRIIRKLSIDELPQLWHVITGQMSLVGPRPAVPEEVLKYESWMLGRLAAKPGLTCTWQVSGRSDIPFERWVKMDIEYIRNRSLWLDLKLLLKTIPAVITGRGAY